MGVVFALQSAVLIEVRRWSRFSWLDSPPSPTYRLRQTSDTGC